MLLNVRRLALAVMTLSLMVALSCGGPVSSDRLSSLNRKASLVTNGTFVEQLAGWAGAHWDWRAGTAHHIAGGTAPLTQSGTTATAGKSYEVVLVLVGSAGSVQLYFGGVWTAIASSTAAHTYYLTASSSDSLSITPTADFDGAIDSISVTELADDASVSNFETSIDFRKSITVHDRIDFPDGRPIAIGFNALPESTTGQFNVPASNVAIGWSAGRVTRTGQITAVGYEAGYNNTTGVLTAFGKYAGYANTDGHATMFGNGAGRSNTLGEVVAVGDETLANSVTAHGTAVGYYAANKANVDITAVGYLAAQGNVHGVGLTALGHMALTNTTASFNTGIGHGAGSTNTGGVVTAVGYRALFSNTFGRATAVGVNSLMSNTSGQAVGIGENAGLANTTGAQVSIGFDAGRSGNNAGVHIGYRAGYSVTSGQVIAIGSDAGLHATTGSVIAIGQGAGEGVGAPQNAPETDTNAILIGHQTGRRMPSANRFDNYVAIGDGVIIDKSGQIKLGSSRHTETNLFGAVVFASAPDVVSSAGAISLATPITHVVSSGARTVLTLANGVEGQEKTIVMKTMTSPGQTTVIAPASRSGYSTIALSAAGHSVRLVFTGGAWVVVGYFGARIT